MRPGRQFMAALAVLLLPYVVTLAWSGGVSGAYGNGLKTGEGTSGGLFGGTGGVSGSQGGITGQSGSESENRQGMRKKIYIGNGQKGYLDVETYLVGTVARQIPAEYGLEALKAQAIITRTYIYGQMDGRTQIQEEELGLKSLGEEQMESLWGRENFVEYYDKISQAV